MSNHFQNQGRALLSRGYLVVPIRKGEKRPAISSWQKSRLGAGDLSRYPDHGVGVLCGQGAHPIVGVDIDVSHPVIGPALIAWCQQHLGVSGERVGAAPRILLAYRAAEAGWAKGASVQFFDPTDPLKPSGKPNNQQVEILGLGQQFVAYHEHPDTHRDYDWIDLFGGLEYIRASDLPVVTAAQVDALLAETARLVRVTEGVEVVGSAEAPMYRLGDSADDDLMSLSAKTDTPIAQMRVLLAHLTNDGDDYDTWTHVGMALHHEYSGADDEAEALDLWKEYGALSSKDDPEQYDYKWRSFGKVSGQPTTLRWLLKVTHQARREAEHHDKRDRLDQIKTLIKAQDDSLKLGGPALVKQLKELLPDDAMVRTEVIGAFQAQFKVLTGTNMPVTQARALIIGTRVATVQTRRPLTEFGNAERMLDRYGDGLMYVPETQVWYSWTGIFWRRAVDVEIEHYAKETIRALPSELDNFPVEDHGKFFEFCAMSQQAKMVRNVVQLASSDPRVVVPAAELDKHSHFMGAANGVIDLRSGKLIDPDPNYRITLTVACDFDPQAKCPLFEATALECFSGDSEMYQFFMRAVGYSAMGDPQEDQMFIPFGNGANGKSTLLGVIRKAFGGYARSAEANSFVSDGKNGNAGGAREDLVRLRASRFVYVNEPDENGELREGAVKSMTGGDAITARGLYSKESVEILPTWTVWMPTNHKPIVKGGDNGIWRRLTLMPFERNFEADPTVAKDPKREEKLMGEMQGVLTLIVRSAISYQRLGLAQPDTVKAARESYRSQMDLLGEWLEDCCEVHHSLSAESNALWMSWELFAKNRGILNYVKSSIALGRRLEARFPNFKGSKGVRMRRGLRILSFDDAQESKKVACVADMDLFS